MYDITTDKLQAASEDLVQILCAYEQELQELDPAAPGVDALRLAIGAALAEAWRCILDRDADGAPVRAVRH